MSDPESEQPNLTPLRAAASQAEFTEAFRGLLSADGYPLAEGEPPVALARDVARSLIEADRYGIYSRTLQLRNAALGGDLHGFGYGAQELGTGGAWLLIGRRDQQTGAGR